MLDGRILCHDRMVWKEWSHNIWPGDQMDEDHIWPFDQNDYASVYNELAWLPGRKYILHNDGITAGSMWRCGYKKLYGESRSSGSEWPMFCYYEFDQNCITREFAKGITKGKKIVAKVNLPEIRLYGRQWPDDHRYDPDQCYWKRKQKEVYQYIKRNWSDRRL